MEFFDIGTIIFMIAAAVILYQLRSVLGRRTGNERQPYDPYSAPRKAPEANAADNVVSLKRKRSPEDEAAAYADIDKVAPADSELNAGLRAIRDADASFEPKSFIDGAKMAYEMIVTAYAAGDRKTLKNLLSRDVFDDFSAAISEREAKGETVQSSFVGVEKADFVSAGVKNGEASVTLKLISQMISATRDKSGVVVDGDPEAVAEVKDIWTFARDTRSKDPNWKLVASQDEDE